MSSQTLEDMQSAPLETEPIETKGEVQLIEIPSCPGCAEKYNVISRLPRVLPCFHTYCGQCIEALMKADSFACPACTRTCIVPHQRSNAFSLNFTLMKVLEQALSQSSPLKCALESCERRAGFRCVECSTVICDEDRREHLKWPKMRDHNIQPLSGDSSYWVQQPLYCIVHNAEMQYICVKDDAIICPHCHALGHSGKEHPCISIDSAYEGEQEQIGTISAEARKAAERYGRGIELVDLTLNEAAETGKKMKEEIIATFEKAREVLKAREEKLLSELDAKINDKIKILREQRKQLTQTQAGIITSYVQMQEVVKHKGKARSLLLRRDLKSNLQYIAKQKLPCDPEVTGDLKFHQGEEKLFDQIPRWGVIEDVSVSNLLSTAAGKGLEIGIENTQGTFQITARDCKGKKVENGGSDLFVVEVGETKSDVKIVDNKDGTYNVSYMYPMDKRDECLISVFLRNRHISGSPFNVRRLKIPEPRFLSRWGRGGLGEGEFRRPVKVACDQSYVYVSEYESHRVQVFTKDDGKFVRRFGSFGTGTAQFNHPYGIDLDESSVYVADYANKRVQVFSKEGEYLRSWDTGGNCTGLTLADGRVYVVDQNSHRIRVFSKTGTIIGNIGRNGTGDGELNYPCDVAVDQNYIYVTDYSNNRVQIFSKENAGFVRKFGKQGTGDGEFSNPVGIAIDRDFIYVTESRMSRVQVFSKEGEYMTKWTGTGSIGDSRFADLYGLAVGEAGLIYGTNYSDHVIQVFQLYP